MPIKWQKLLESEIEPCRGMKSKPDLSKIQLTLPEDLTNELREEADMQYRSLNNYILWLLVNRDKNKPE